MKRNSNQNTARYILDKVAPIFNKKGYVGTSLSDLNEATQLTKGAIYCNFKNKHDLALQAFRYNVKEILSPLNTHLEKYKSSIEKLYALTSYYRSYYAISKDRGGCPILNVSIDAKHINPVLYKAAKEVSEKLIKGLKLIIQKGIKNGEIKGTINAETCSKNIFTMIEGGVFMAFTQEDEEYLLNILDHIEILIKEKIQE